jgi:hypothetical protein
MRGRRGGPQALAGRAVAGRAAEQSWVFDRWFGGNAISSSYS